MTGWEPPSSLEECLLIALVPRVVDAVEVPVIATGGIADGRGVAAAFALASPASGLRSTGSEAGRKAAHQAKEGTMKLWLMVALIAVMAVSAHSQEGKYRSGNFLLETCEAENPVSWDYCRAFIAGAGDGFETGSIYGGGGQPFCYPEGNTLGQAVRIVTKYLKEHPETLHYFAAELVALALIEAWPCE